MEFIESKRPRLELLPDPLLRPSPLLAAGQPAGSEDLTKVNLGPQLGARLPLEVLLLVGLGRRWRVGVQGGGSSGKGLEVGQAPSAWSWAAGGGQAPGLSGGARVWEEVGKVFRVGGAASAKALGQDQACGHGAAGVREGKAGTGGPGVPWSRELPSGGGEDGPVVGGQLSAHSESFLEGGLFGSLSAWNRV